LGVVTPRAQEFYKNFLQMILKNFEIENNEGNTKEIDEKLNARLSGQKDRRIYRKV